MANSSRASHCWPMLSNSNLKNAFRNIQKRSSLVRFISCSYPKCDRTGYGTGPEARVQGRLDERTEDYMRTNHLKPKQHPGVYHTPKISLPEKFTDAVQKIFSHENIKAIYENAPHLRNYVWSRRLPIENEQFKTKVSKLEEQTRLKDEAMLPFLSEDETLKLEKKRESAILRQIRYSVYHWEPIQFTQTKSLEYLLARSAGEYASLYRIFYEISKRDPKFQPKTLCDFGSGIGTVTWAARSFWESSLIEHMCADVSAVMNEISELILRGGCKNNDHPIPALFFRQHLPESFSLRYDLVVSAYSLMELPSAKDRLQMIDKLWKKAEEYLVIVEPGTRAGFRAVMEARDYVLGLQSPKGNNNNSYVFSPCPSSSECPRFNFDTIPCNFEVKYRPLYPFHIDGCDNDRFCYVVLRRGQRSPDDEMWPRLVDDPIVRTKHVICRVCTKDAKVSELVLTKSKHSQSFRLIAKRSRWGDLLPIRIEEKENSRNPSEGVND